MSALVNESELFNAGFTNIFTKEKAPADEIKRIVVVGVLGDAAITELERYWHLFEEVSMVNLTISGSNTKELIRVSPLRKKLKGFVEASLNFLPFIDSVYLTHSTYNQSEAH